MNRSLAIAGCLTATLLGGAAQAESAIVAVASNFTAVAEELAAAFKAETGHDLVLSFGASGALYAQITQAAPFDVFLSADAARPAKAEADGFAVAGTSFTYAIGKLVLLSAGADITDGEAALRRGDYKKLSIADPVTAPYGAAALQVLDRLGIAAEVTPKLVTGANIAQALQFVETGNAELGFVAASQVGETPATQLWLVPAAFYAPILQDAVLLRTGEANPAASAFLDYLKSDAGKAIITAGGYGVE